MYFPIITITDGQVSRFAWESDNSGVWTAWYSWRREERGLFDFWVNDLHSGTHDYVTLDEIEDARIRAIFDLTNATLESVRAILPNAVLDRSDEFRALVAREKNAT